MKLLIVGGLLAVLCANMAAQLQETQLTCGTRNGRFWQASNEDEKLGFIEGYMEGAKAALLDSRIPDELQTTVWESRFAGKSTIGEILKGVDGFYADPANALIPIQFAIAVFRERVRGSSPENLEKRIATIRKAMNCK